MSTRFDHIVAIYNPNSTNAAEERAREFRDEAREKGLEVELIATERRGHAIDIAKEIVTSYPHPLLVSVSGDGGYNELINGVIEAERPDSDPVVAIIAAGNANDHKVATRTTPLVELIADHAVKPMDLLYVSHGETHRYAHSYIGIGYTPTVGRELNKRDLWFIEEIKIIIDTFRHFTPVKITEEGKPKTYSSLVFANIPRMAKVLKLDEEQSDLTDNAFEVVETRGGNRWQLLKDLVRSIFFANNRSKQVRKYTFTTIDELAVQLDGEIIIVPANTDVTITSTPGKIHCLRD